MLRKLLFLLPVCASVLPGCMTTPPLSEATGEEHSEIMIKDVVQRVKCELSEAFDKKVEQREFLWLTGWTAHADLTLTINDTAGVSPNGSYTKYQGKTTTSGGEPPCFRRQHFYAERQCEPKWPGRQDRDRQLHGCS